MYKCSKCGWNVSDEDRGLPGETRIGGSNWVRYGKKDE